MLECARCGRSEPSDSVRVCPGCGGALRAAPLPGPISISRGDTGLDKSVTSIHSSAQTSSTRDDHSIRDDHSVRDSRSVRNVTKDDHSSRATTIRTNIDNRVKHSRVNIGGGVLVFFAMIAALGFAMWVINRQAQPSAITLSPSPNQLVATPVVSTPVSSPTGVPPTPIVQQAPAPQPPVAGAAPPPVATPPKLDRTKYLNIGSIRPGLVAVLMVDERRGADALLTQRMAAALGGNDDLFKPAFVGDGLFSRVHRGDIDLLRELGIGTDVAEIALGTRAATFSGIDVSGTPMTRASVTLSVRITRPSAGFVSNMQAAPGVGAGFDEASALALATENALKVLLKQMGR